MNLESKLKKKLNISIIMASFLILFLSACSEIFYNKGRQHDPSKTNLEESDLAKIRYSVQKAELRDQAVKPIKINISPYLINSEIESMKKKVKCGYFNKATKQILTHVVILKIKHIIH